MRTLILFKGAVKRSIRESFRYTFELASGLVVFYVVFALIFFGARALIGAGVNAEDTLSAIVVGYLVWILAIMAYSNTAQGVTEEATAGTFEQLAMSPLGLGRVMTARFVGSMVPVSLIIVLLLVLMMATSGRWLHLDLVSILPILLLTLAGVFGLGLVLAGFAVVFKRIQSMIQIVQFLFVGLIAVPMDRVPAFKYLPLAWGNHLLRQVMVDEVSITAMPVGDVAFLVVHTAAWLAFGYMGFAVLERAARERGLLGHY